MVPNELKDWIDLIYKVGFPIFVATYLLTRIDRLLSKQSLQQQEMLGLLRDIKNALFLRRE